MSRIRGVIGLAAICMFVAACSSGTTSTSSSPSAASGGTSLHFYFVTHGDNGTFWTVVQNGQKQAATDLGVQVNYQGSNNDDTQECQFISAAVTAKPDGLAVSPHSQTVLDCAKQAAAGGIPLILINNCGVTSSGQSYIAYSGALTCVGQPETAAGQQAGVRLKADGGTKLLCVIHEATSTSLRDRCAGAKTGFGGTEIDLVLDNAKSNVSSATATLQAKLSADSSIDSILALDPDVAKNIVEAAVAGASSKAKIATFDISAPVIADIQSGKIDFAVDQQQYLQGYLPIVFLKLYKQNANTVGGFDTVKSGPGIVDKSNASAVASLAAKGTR
ncbi:MAG: sugar ABC transporter substrate-binding protein [Candidatus Dormibacteraeota bacterium]|nr:sugar ABC transporter substrate-binding protein [Candidatus Dormibacteraeota bacterium]